MSRNNKFLVISVFLGTMFFSVSSGAMENKNQEIEQENSNEINNTLKDYEYGEKKEGGNNLKNEIKESDNKVENNINKNKEKENESKIILNNKIENSSENQENKIKSEEELREELKNYGYGVTKGQQQKTKEWIESWGFDNGLIYRKMQTRKYKDILECLKELIEEKIKEFRDHIKELKEILFKCEISERPFDFYENFYKPCNEGFDIKLDEENFNRTLKLIQEKGLSESLIVDFIENRLPFLQKILYEIDDYSQLIENAYNYYIYDKSCRFIENGYCEGIGKDKKYYNIYTLSSIEILKKEYEEIKKEVGEFEELTNSDSSDVEEDIKNLNNKIDNSNNEIINWAKVFIDMWGGSLDSLYNKNKIVNLKDIKKHVKKIVINNYNIFNKILERFEKYKFEFENIGIEKSIIVDKSKFFNFKKELKKIIDEENKSIQEEYGLLINSEVVKDYVEGELMHDETLQKQIKNYMQLIKKAYTACINGHIDNQDKVLKESNFNFYKFWYKGYNIDVESNDDEIVYRFNKKDKIDIYTKEAKDKIKTEYEEMQFVLNMKSILEKIKSQDKNQISEECSNILKTNTKGFTISLNYLGDLLEGKISEEDYKKYLIKDSPKVLESKTIELKKNLNILEDMFDMFEERIKDEKQNLDYCKMFAECLKQAIDENIFEQFIDEIIDLTKEEYYPGRFIKKFRKLISRKYSLIHKVNYINIGLNKIKERPNEDIDRFFLSDMTECKFYGYIKFKKGGLEKYEDYKLLEELKEYLKRDFETIKSMNGLEDSFFKHYYISAIISLSSEHKLTFFKELKKVLKEDFKEVEKARDIALFAEDICGLCSKAKKHKEELIDKIGDNIGKENIEKFKDIFNFVDMSEYGDIIKIISKCANDFANKNMLKFNQTEFFNRLKTVITGEYEYRKRFYEIKKILETMEEKSGDIIKDPSLKEKLLNELIEKIGSVMIDDVKTKLRYIFEKSEDNELKNFICNSYNIYSCSDLSECLSEFFVSIENEYKKIRKNVLKEDIDNILRGVHSENVEEFMQSDEYERLRKMCEELYILEKGPFLNFDGVSIFLNYDTDSNSYYVETKANGVAENNNINNNNNFDDYYDFNDKGVETRPGTEI